MLQNYNFDRINNDYVWNVYSKPDVLYTIDVYVHNNFLQFIKNKNKIRIDT